MKNINKPVLVYALTLLGITIWLSSIFLAPYLKSQGSWFNVFIYTAFSPVCHQIPSRCFHLFGFPLAVCARCLGIYSGFLIGTLIYPWLMNFSSSFLPKNIIFFLVTFPIVIDTSGNLISLWNTQSWIRFLIGAVWGTILPFYFIHGLIDLFRRPEKK